MRNIRNDDALANLAKIYHTGDANKSRITVLDLYTVIGWGFKGGVVRSFACLFVFVGNLLIMYLFNCFISRLDGQPTN